MMDEDEYDSRLHNPHITRQPTNHYHQTYHPNLPPTPLPLATANLPPTTPHLHPLHTTYRPSPTTGQMDVEGEGQGEKEENR